MTKSQLIETIAEQVPAIPRREVEAIVNAVFDCMAEALARGQRIEIRGFGSFAVKTRPSRDGRNPKTGERVAVPPRRSLTFTVGKELRDRLNPGGTLTSRPIEPATPDAHEPLPAPAQVSISPATSPGPGHASPEPLAASGPPGTRYTLG